MTMVGATSINWFAKLAALGIGLAFIGIGLAIIRLGGPVFVGLNKMYAQLPGRWQYPAWWHRFLGALIVGFGLLFAIAGVLLAGRQIQNGP
jgi:hypothetical protein